jgi:S1-C subfamily serine protease/serine/threonine protein kinase
MFPSRCRRLPGQAGRITLSEAAALLPGDPDRIGAYRVAGRLGQGGQGTVYLAEDPSGEKVAVKLIQGVLNDNGSARARFVAEIGAVKRVARFCTAQVLDADVDGQRPYIVSEYVPGPSLHQRITEDGPLNGGALERLAIGTVTALVAIHQAGVVHRDFKPHNVIMGPDGPRVIDFGIAKALDSTTTTSVALVGTPAFMAPEQLTWRTIGPPVDVFAWGVTLGFAATGRLAFGRGSVVEIAGRILHGEPDLEGLTGPLRDLVAAALAKDAAKRPTADQLLAALLGRALPQQTPAWPGKMLDLGTAAASQAGRFPQAPRSRTVSDAGPPAGRSAPPTRSKGPHLSPAAAAWIAGGVAAALTLAVGGFLLSDGPLFGGDERNGPDSALSSPPQRLTLSQLSQGALRSVVEVAAEGGDGVTGGSGFFVRGGNILTVNHILGPGKPAPKVTITLNDKRRLNATIVGRDAARNVAVLRPSGLSNPPPALPIGDSAKIAAGDWIAYISAPYGLGGTVKQGSVGKINSAVYLAKPSDDVILRAIQLNAQLAPGDPGGPVLDAYGRVIGVLDASMNDPSSTASAAPHPGIGFALPINQSMMSVTHIIENNGQAPKHATLGVTLEGFFEGPGARITTQDLGGRKPMAAGGPAERAGLRPGDVISKVNGERVANTTDLIAYVLDQPPGAKVRITFLRNDVENTVDVTLGAK